MKIKKGKKETRSNQLKETSVKEARATPPTIGSSAAMAIPDGSCFMFQHQQHESAIQYALRRN
jgi:hypothetical protein